MFRVGDILRQKRDIILWFQSCPTTEQTHEGDLYVFAGPETVESFVYVIVIHMSGRKVRLSMEAVRNHMEVVHD